MMNDQSRPVTDDASSHDPMKKFRRQFAEIRALMDAQIGPHDREAMVYQPEIFDKVRDMVRGQVLLLRAEKVLDDEFKRLRDAGGERELTELRDQIGRTLDRIRATLDPEDVLGGAEQK